MEVKTQLIIIDAFCPLIEGQASQGTVTFVARRGERYVKLVGKIFRNASMRFFMS